MVEKNKYIVIFKIPISVDEDSYLDAFTKASAMCENVYGVKPSPFAADIFQLDEDNKIIDKKFFHPIMEYNSL